ncbi:MAG TPA: SEC-C metal-binding domain-containing protein [Verrucomicrobiae bacterium]
MNPELRLLIDDTHFHRAAMRQAVGLLPPDDAGLDSLLVEIIAANDIMAFMVVTVTATHAGRRMDARHLEHGTKFFPSEQWMGRVAIHMHGDVPAHLLAAVQNTRLEPMMEASALHLAAALTLEQPGKSLPAALMPLARAAARRLKPNSIKKDDINTFSLLRFLATRTGDNDLTALLRQRYSKLKDKKWHEMDAEARRADASIVAGYRKPIEEMVHEKPNPAIALGSFTLRRSVPRLGRNEACHCGSGKKYKHCCYEKDKKRLHESTEVAGMTFDELEASQEEHLTGAGLDGADAFVLAPLDPRKIAPALHPLYLSRLVFCKLLDRAAEAMEILGWSGGFLEAWNAALLAATGAGRRDIAQRLLRLRQPQGFTEDKLDLAARLLLASDDATRCLQLIEETARQALQTENHQTLQALAQGVSASQFPALGILLYRSVLPLAAPDRAAQGLEQVQLVRDRLNLPLDDPFSDLIDRRLAELQDEARDAAAMREAQHRLDGKVQEVQQLKESLIRLQREISRRETQPAAPKQTPQPPAAPGDERALRELRGKVEALHEALKERHNERNELRRELQKAQADLDTLRQSAAPVAPAEAEPDHEEELLLPQDAPEIHPVRLIEFPKGFQQALAAFPRHVARAAVIMAGRLAAGEPAAFVGALRLKQVPNVMRQRIGSDYRLLFRLHPGHLQVLDLINRKDFHHRLKTLK